MSLSYRNQSIDLQSKSMDWFLYIGTSVMKEFQIKSFQTVSIIYLKHAYGFQNECEA